MGKKKDIPPDFATHEQGNLFRCIACFESDPLTARWLKKGSLHRHLESADHINRVDVLEKREAKKLRDEQRLREIYSMDTTEPTSSFAGPSVDHRMGMFDSTRTMFSHSDLPDDFSAGLEPSRPSKIVAKMKLQILPHLMEDIRRFGPAIRNSTEIFECFNAVFRLCSILSNHQAPSRDIAVKFAAMDRVKHILSGGYWNPSKDHRGEWVRADEKVRHVLLNDPVIQRHLGWTPPRKIVPGSVRFVGQKKSPSFDWEMSKASRYCRLPSALQFSESTAWRKVLNSTSQSGDICSTGSWVFARDLDDKLVIGRISEIVGPDTKNTVKSGVVTIEVFELGAEQHPDFSLPVLCRPAESGASSHIAIHTKKIMFTFSVQHDCRTAACAATALRAQVQEREVTEKMDKLIAHSDDDHSLVNLYALHNANLLRRVLPRELYTPTPLYQDRRKRHYEQAAVLHIQKEGKRAETKKKRAEKAAKKKADAAEAARKGKDLHESEEEVDGDGDVDMDDDIGDDIGDEDLEREDRHQGKRKRTC